MDCISLKIGASTAACMDCGANRADQIDAAIKAVKELHKTYQDLNSMTSGV